MTTRQLEITTDWQKITDGTQTALFDVLSGAIMLHDAATKPAANAPGHRIDGQITIYPPTVAWVRVSSGKSAKAIIS